MKLKHVAFLTATAMLVGGLSSAAMAEMNVGPLKANGMCWANSSPNNLGYWATCPAPAKAVHMKKHKKMGKK